MCLFVELSGIIFKFVGRPVKQTTNLLVLAMRNFLVDGSNAYMQCVDMFDVVWQQT